MNKLITAAAVLVFLPSLMNGQSPQVPETVMKGLKARFPDADIRKWTKEEEDGTVIYDFEFLCTGEKFEADVREDGSIHNWEKRIDVKDLPDAVRLAVEDLYPGSVPVEAMQVTAVEDGKDELEGYEILLTTDDGDEVEVTVAPDGEILEDSGAGE